MSLHKLPVLFGYSLGFLLHPCLVDSDWGVRSSFRKDRTWQVFDETGGRKGQDQTMIKGTSGAITASGTRWLASVLLAGGDQQRSTPDQRDLQGLPRDR